MHFAKCCTIIYVNWAFHDVASRLPQLQYMVHPSRAVLSDAGFEKG
jgi:hypothetical protein